MIRWLEPDSGRLRPQEMALLSLCDRMTAVEQMVTVEVETQRQLITEQARRLSQQHDKLREQREMIRRLEDRLRRLELAARTSP